MDDQDSLFDIGVGIFKIIIPNETASIFPENWGVLHVTRGVDDSFGNNYLSFFFISTTGQLYARTARQADRTFHTDWNQPIYSTSANPLIKTLYQKKDVSSIAASGWAASQTINFTVPSGYMTLAGACVINNGYCILYNNSWESGATSCAPSIHNIGSSAQSPTIYARVLCVRNDIK